MLLPALNRPGIRVIRSIFSLAIALSPAMLFGQGDPVPNYVVNTTADDATGTASNCTSSPEGICTLRDALAAANAVSASNITFDPTVFKATNSAAANTITLANGTLNIPTGATITGLTSGSGATLTNLVTVSGNNATTVFSVASGVTAAVIANLIIKDGNTQDYFVGGGITNSGELTVAGSTFSGNSAPIGGAIANVSFFGSIELTVTDSTFSGNSGGGGAIYAYVGTGGYVNPITVTGSTFSGNSPGAISLNNVTLTLKSSTISDNVGDGISVYSTSLNIANSIVDILSFDSGSTLNDLGGNLLNSSVSPNVSQLGNYGGPTQTMLPQPGSAAICGGIAANIPAGVTTDQRGYSIENTTYPGYSASTPCVDSGAVQTNYAMAFTIQPPADATVNEAIAPAPVVTVTESGNRASAATGTMRMTDSSDALSGATSEGLLSGATTFPGLELTSEVNDDIFTAWLGLNPMLNISAQASVGVTAVAATGPLPATMLLPAPGTATVVGTSNILFQWTGGADVTSYALLIGTNGAGTSNILNTGPITTVSYTLHTLPADGVTLFVRLSSLINGAWQYEDYVYTESGTAIPATLSPSSGTLLPSQTFTWNNGNDAIYYQLTVGTTGPGSTNILGTGVTTETSAKVSIPGNGTTVFATLYQLVDGAWQHTDYTFTAPTIYLVNTAADDATGTASNCASSPEGQCTLRDALAAANAVSASNITFDPTVFKATNSAAANTITLANGTLNIPTGATITGLTSGSGATLTNLVTISGNYTTTVFTVYSGGTGAVIANLNITDGSPGISNSAGVVTVIGSTFSGNNGSAISSYSNGTLTGPAVTVIGSTFSGNSSSGDGGAIWAADTNVTVTGSTFSGNLGGGAIFVCCGAMRIENSTISGNYAANGDGGGIFDLGATLNVANSIVEGNTTGVAGATPDIGLIDIGPTWGSSVNDLGGIRRIRVGVRSQSVARKRDKGTMSRRDRNAAIASGREAVD